MELLRDAALIETDQIDDLDDLAMRVYGLSFLQLMELEGFQLAYLARERFLGLKPSDQRVAVLIGVGGNGGGVAVCARHLNSWGIDVDAFVTDINAVEADTLPAQHVRIAQRMSIPMNTVDALDEAQPPDLVVDGILGWQPQGPPAPSAARAIAWCNAQDAPVLANDVPSGSDMRTGLVHEPTVRATATLTHVLVKKRLLDSVFEPYIGELYLADIGIPTTQLGLDNSKLFATESIVRLH